MSPTQPKISIIILNWNGREDTTHCLESLQVVDYPNFDIILIDNGSTDGSISALRRKFPHVTFIENGENLGFAEGNNRGIVHALEKNADFIFLLNNDTIVDPQVLKAFVGLEGDSTLILGPKLYLYRDPTRFDHLGGEWNQKLGEFKLIGVGDVDDGIHYEESIPLDYVCGAALFAPAEAFKRVGLLEPRFFLYWEESDWCFRAKKLGFQIGLCPKAKVWHKGSASFSGRPHTTYFWWRNRLLWIERNLQKSERGDLYRRVIVPQVCKLAKLWILKNIQIALLVLFSSKKNQRERRDKARSYRAALCGITHYLRRRFGNAPRWVFTSRKND